MHIARFDNWLFGSEMFLGLSRSILLDSLQARAAVECVTILALLIKTNLSNAFFSFLFRNSYTA